MNDQENIGATPSGWQLERTLLGHNGLISRVEWAPNGELLASPSFDRTIKLWDGNTGECVHTLIGHEGRVWAVAWSPDSKFIASGSIDNTVRLWDTDTGELKQTFDTPSGNCLNMAWSPDGELIAAGGIGDNWSIIIGYVKTRKSQILEGHNGQVNSVAWAPDGKTFASVSHDTTVRLWDRYTLETKKILTGHSADVHSVNWAPDGKMLASASLDHTIRLWNPQTGQTIFVLEGHTASVNCVEFSHDGKFLASKSSDGTVRLWRCDTWETVTILPEETVKYLPFGLAFHPTKPILATLGAADIAVRVWKLDSEALLRQSPANPSDLYRNAKVVLVGESGVGKSGLSLVLTNKEFRPTESTHGRYVWTFHTKELTLSDHRKELQEILLWDLAGQPGYRLIHQLYLNELAVALIVCDARSETDPFAGVYYWNRALRQAEKLQGDSAPRLKKFLVTARADRGSVSVSKARIEKLVQELGFDGHFETSAKEGLNIKELASAICDAVEWENLPKVISTKLFQQIKVFLIQEKKAQRLLSPVDDLYRSFVQSNGSNSIPAREEFETCIRLVESRDLIRRLSFGNLILLQPELLDAYASAIINAAKDEPEGLGQLAEEDVLIGRFRMSFEERISDKKQEELLLIATVEELLAREIALRVQTDIGPLLVFPSQMTREWPEAPDPEGKAVILEFEGAVVSIYTTLTVRLSRSIFFKCKELWKNAAIFEAQVGGECGIWLSHVANTDEGRARLTLFFKPEASEQTRLQFEEYVCTQLKRRALPETIKRKRIFVCHVCATSVSESQEKARRERGFDSINCNVCGTLVPLLDSSDPSLVAKTEIPCTIIPQMDKAADIQREIETATSIIKGKEATNDFDVFLSHNSKDKPLVEVIANHLRKRGLNPWLDKSEIPAGKLFQDYITDGITKSKSAAVFISSNGLGNWQREELRILNNLRVTANLSLIPVLLPGMNAIPDQPSILLFLRELNWVCFNQDVDELKPLEQLIKGIKGLPLDD